MNKALETQFYSAEASPGFLFWKVANLHQRLQRQVLKNLEISPTQFSILACYFFLKSEQNLPTQSDICKMAGLDKMHVSDTTNALLLKKLVKKKINKNDKRSFQIELTEKGQDICNKAVRLIEDLDQKFFALSNNSKEFHNMLKRITSNVQSIM